MIEQTQIALATLAEKKICCSTCRFSYSEGIFNNIKTLSCEVRKNIKGTTYPNDSCDNYMLSVENEQ